MPIVQAKLRIGASNDKYEQEADRVADEVMRMPDAKVAKQPTAQASSHSGEVLHRKCDACASGEALCSECEEEEKLRRQPIAPTKGELQVITGDDEEELQRNESAMAHTPVATPMIAASINVMRNSGQPLAASVKNFFHPRFGVDLSYVKVHTDPRATAVARAMNARAFTVGSNIAFAEGQYAPGGTAGRHLLAHELTHVIQQTGNGQTPCPISPVAPQVQRASILGCTATQTDEVKTALNQANADFDAALPVLETSPPSQKAQDAMWLTFRDTDEVKTLIVKEILGEGKDLLSNMPIHCEQLADYKESCKAGADAYHSRGAGLNIHLCMDKWARRFVKERARTLIHESAHNVPFVGDFGYFSETCEKSADTAALSMSALFTNADSYACLAYLLSHETEADLSSRVEYYQREYRGETLEGIVQDPPGSIDLSSTYEHLPRFYVKFEGEEGPPYESKIPGAQYRWSIADDNGTVYPLGSPGQEGNFSKEFTALIQKSTRQLLKKNRIHRATIQCDIKIPGAEMEQFTVQRAVTFIALIPGWKDISTIPFETGSADPNLAAMNQLSDTLISYGILMSRDGYHIDFEGHASRSGDDDDNFELSRRRAKAVKDGLELLLQSASEGIAFEFYEDQFKVTGHGEERARKARKPRGDDSASDRVVEVVFEVVSSHK